MRKGALKNVINALIEENTIQNTKQFNMSVKVELEVQFCVVETNVGSLFKFEIRMSELFRVYSCF